MTQSVLNTFKILIEGLKLGASNLLKYGITNILKTLFKLIKNLKNFIH